MRTLLSLIHEDGPGLKAHRRKKLLDMGKKGLSWAGPKLRSFGWCNAILRFVLLSSPGLTRGSIEQAEPWMPGSSPGMTVLLVASREAFEDMDLAAGLP